MSTPTKRERREAARQARLEREAAEAAAARRKRRLVQVGAAIAAAVVLVVVAVLVSSGGGSKSGGGSGSGGSSSDVAGLSETTAMLQGLPQTGTTLGKPNAPVTIYEFADLQCPFCKEFATQNLPKLVRDYVATGKAKLVYQDMAFIPNGSEDAAAAADAAGQQNKLWYFTNLFYWNQGQEQTGYVTDAFVNKIYGAVPGLDVAKANAARKVAPATKAFDEPRKLADQYGVTSTPTFVAGPTGGTLKKLNASGSDYNSIKSALDPIVASAKSSQQ
jgi:protein-disulfide isomerase